MRLAAIAACMVVSGACSAADLWLAPGKSVTIFDAADASVRLVITASVDGRRTGAVFRDGYVRAETGLRRALRGHLSSPPAFIALLLFAVAALAVARLAGGSGQALGAVQLVPSVALLLATGVLIDIALSDIVPGAYESGAEPTAPRRSPEELRQRMSGYRSGLRRPREEGVSGDTP